jgi:hypothetical protein
VLAVLRELAQWLGISGSMYYLSSAYWLASKLGESMKCFPIQKGVFPKGGCPKQAATPIENEVLMRRVSLGTPEP